MQHFDGIKQKKDERIYVYLCEDLKNALKIYKKESGMEWDQLFFHLCTTISPPEKYQSKYQPKYEGERDRLLNVYISALTLMKFNMVNARFNKQADCIDYLMSEQSKKTPFDNQPISLFSA